MVLRTLTRSPRRQLGDVTLKSSGYQVLTRDWPQQWEQMQDDVVAGDNKLFRVQRVSVSSDFTVNGESFAGNPTKGRIYNNYPLIDAGVSTWRAAHTNLPGARDNANLATGLLAMTNPSRPSVDLPVFIAELKDVPQLFKIVGETALKTLSKANLAFWFGWKPLASDLMKMCDFSSIANKRYKELKALHESGLRCTRELDKLSSGPTKSPQNFITEVGGEVLTQQYVIENQRFWGHVKWFPTSLPPRTDDEMINLARRAAFGLTIDPSTAWELIPFSWLVDWFTNVGTYLQAKRNIVGAEHRDLSIMKHKTKNFTFSLDKLGVGLDVGLGSILSESKVRDPVSIAQISAHLPYLNLRQLSILGSLWVLKNGRNPGLWRL